MTFARWAAIVVCCALVAGAQACSKQDFESAGGDPNCYEEVSQMVKDIAGASLAELPDCLMASGLLGAAATFEKRCAAEVGEFQHYHEAGSEAGLDRRSKVDAYRLQVRTAKEKKEEDRSDDETDMLRRVSEREAATVSFDDGSNSAAYGIAPVFIETPPPQEEVEDGLLKVTITPTGTAEPAEVIQASVANPECWSVLRARPEEGFYAVVGEGHPVFPADESLHLAQLPISVSEPTNLYVFATRYKGMDNCDGTSVLKVKTIGGEGNTIGESRVALRAAEWMMMGHSMDIRESSDMLHIAESHDTFQGIHVKPASAEFQVHGKAPFTKAWIPVGDDPDWAFGQASGFFQDSLEIGNMATPRSSKYSTFLLDGSFRGIPAESVADDHFSVLDKGDMKDLDMGGNIEVTPPTPKWPHGRIYYGGAMSGIRTPVQPKLGKFLGSLTIQKPIPIWSEWLLVGHVDEFLTIVPASNDIGFKFVYNSPKLMEEMLIREYEKNNDASVVATSTVPKFARGLSQGDQTKYKDRVNGYTKTVDELISGAGADTLWAFNRMIEAAIQVNIHMLIDAFDGELTKDHFIPVPAYFQCKRMAQGEDHPGPCSHLRTVKDVTDAVRARNIEVLSTRYTGVAEAYMPNYVNALVTPGVSTVAAPRSSPPTRAVAVMGDPYTDFVKAHVEDVLPEVDIRWVDNLENHPKGGDVHCATNPQRVPSFPTPWWTSEHIDDAPTRASAPQQLPRKYKDLWGDISDELLEEPLPSERVAKHKKVTIQTMEGRSHDVRLSPDSTVRDFKNAHPFGDMTGYHGIVAGKQFRLDDDDRKLSELYNDKADKIHLVRRFHGGMLLRAQ